jgi:phospholipid/cholesterol/gamma-HCH transport system substrate-binding protein
MATEKKHPELLVGTFVLFGCLLLGSLILQFGRFGDKFTDTYSLTLIVDDAAGIIKGSEIRMGGAKIGRVENLPELTDEAHVKIDLLVDDRIKIPEGSMLGVASASLLGDKMIVVTPPKVKTGGFIAPDTIIRGSGPTGLDAIQSNAEILSHEARNLMEGAGVTLKKVDGAVDDMREASQQLTQAIKKVNESVLKPENLAQVDTALRNFTETSEQLKKTSVELEPALADARRAIQSIEKAADGAEKTFAKADQRIDELGPAFAELPKATRAITQAANKANTTMDQVVKGNGLLGTLTNDNEVSTDAKAFIRNLKERGILRYQDKESVHPADDPRNRFRGRRP